MTIHKRTPATTSSSSTSFSSHSSRYTKPISWHTLLVLGRTSNLPTVWSNCFVGWFLGGAGSLFNLLEILLAGTFLYLGGMYWNDAFDSRFDTQFRRERPIPSGQISSRTVWILGGLFLSTGTLILAFNGLTTFLLALGLLGSIILYDAVHKMITFSPILMASCRLFLILTAASCGSQGVTGLAVWTAMALAGYIIGLSHLAKQESLSNAVSSAPCYLLLSPIFLAVIVNSDVSLLPLILIGGILLLWIVRCLWFTFGSSQRQIGKTVSGLLAGIVLVDWLALCQMDIQMIALFIGLFFTALIFQKFIPAT